MSDQLALLPDPTVDAIGAFHAPDKGAPETELGAAVDEYPRTGTARLKVLLAIARMGDVGLTDAEGAQTTGLYLYTYAPRRVELRDAGWIEDSGRRRLVTRSRKPAAAWRLSAAGLLELRRRGTPL